MDLNLLKKIRLGDALIEAGYLTDAQLKTALEQQKGSGEKLGKLLVRLDFVEENKVVQVLSEQLKLPLIELDKYAIKSEVVAQLNERVARRLRVMPIDNIQGKVLLVMADPTDVIAYDEVRRILKQPLTLGISKELDLLNAFDKIYSQEGNIVSFAEELKEELEGNISDDEIAAISDSAPVAKLLDSIFEDAVMKRASDIHIEPEENIVRIRKRVDGVLQEDIMKGKEIVSALVLRIKLIANLDISEKRLPQDGRFFMKVKGRRIDVRISSMPVQHGESVVMRLLDQSKGILKLSQLGMNDHILKRMEFLLPRPGGMVLVTGPTGSGKTTTLYAGLSELNTKEKKIITIEDPVEYTLPRVNQVQTNAEIGLTFSSVLRSVLRQDPDIVMIGEIRDEETARIALRAAMTGHTVLSTVHTNNSISTAMRLIDMGAEGFLVASALRGVLAQRLVRRNCKNCLASYQPSEQEKSWLKLLLNKNADDYNFKQGAGCEKCDGSGYLGRIGVYELLEITTELANYLRDENTKAFNEKARQQEGFCSLSKSVFNYATQGDASLEEVFRIASEVDDSSHTDTVDE